MTTNPNTNHTITTPAGRTITFTAAALANIEECGLCDQIDDDVEQLTSGGSLAALIAHCQDGAAADRLDGWSDYCAAILHTADNEMLAAQNTATALRLWVRS